MIANLQAQAMLNSLVCWKMSDLPPAHFGAAQALSATRHDLPSTKSVRDDDSSHRANALYAQHCSTYEFNIKTIAQ
jgi:hypothetical protein